MQPHRRATRVLSGALLALAASSLASPVALAAPVIWSGNGHSYEVVAVPVDSWNSAQAACAASGGYLATLTSGPENDFVYQLLIDGDPISAWIGGFQADGAPEPLEGWSWVSGEPFEYANWRAGEPNNGFGNFQENRIMFFTLGMSIDNNWNDVSEGAPLAGYVCERDIPVGVEQARDPSRPRLFVRRNPMLGLAPAWIDFAVPNRGPVTLRVYNVAGALMRTLVEGEAGPGTNHAAWDGRDGSGARVPAGVYFVALGAGTHRLGHRLVVLP